MGRLELWAKASELIEICHKVGCGNVGGWNSARLRRASEIVIEQVASECRYRPALQADADGRVLLW
jgi:hypothetical protein